MVDPSSRYTPVVISTFTSHLWKRKKGLVLVVCITTYQPWLVIAWKIAACEDMWNVHSTVTWGIRKENEQRESVLFSWVIARIMVFPKSKIYQDVVFP